jgi:hypothetical protein
VNNRNTETATLNPNTKNTKNTRNTNRPILPRFTVRTFLWSTAVLGGCSWVVARAIRGERWAQGSALAMLFLAMVFLLYAIAYAAAYVVASRAPKVTPPTSPFAGQDPPEQVMVPVEQFPKT